LHRRLRPAAVLLVLLTNCAEDQPHRLRATSSAADTDPCFQLFDKAWVHVERMKALHRSLASELTSHQSMSATTRGERLQHGLTYSLEREHLISVAEKMNQQGCPPADLERIYRPTLLAISR
jgi:hypothetical protein